MNRSSEDSSEPDDGEIEYIEKIGEGGEKMRYSVTALVSDGNTFYRLNYSCI